MATCMAHVLRDSNRNILNNKTSVERYEEMIKQTKYTNWTDVCWDECEKMWRYVAKKYDGRTSVITLKNTWMHNNGYEKICISGDCFFCHHRVMYKTSCRSCPAAQVDRSFMCCRAAYHYETKPKLFYKEIVRLNKIRKAQK